MKKIFLIVRYADFTKGILPLNYYGFTSTEEEAKKAIEEVKRSELKYNFKEDDVEYKFEVIEKY